MKAQNQKHLIKSYDKLPQEARDAFDEKYGEGYAEAAQKITKPDGSILYVVPLETDDAVYMVKVDLVIDTNFSEEEFEKEAFGRRYCRRRIGRGRERKRKICVDSRRLFRHRRHCGHKGQQRRRIKALFCKPQKQKEELLLQLLFFVVIILNQQYAKTHR